jgi:hypothetical protein
MTNFQTMRTDTWVLSLPSDWLEKEITEEGSLNFESADGEKALYISTWNLGENITSSSKGVAESFKATDLSTLLDMDGYSWQIIEEETTHSATATIVVVDSLAEAKSYRIVGKILVRLPVVVRASFHDYACSNYAASKASFTSIIESLHFYEPAV